MDTSLPPEIAARFWSYVDKSGDCWLWTGSRTSDGYGHMNVRRGQLWGAHRLAWVLSGNPLPAGDLDHVCHNKSDCPGGPACVHRRCVNPAHLRPSSRGDNVRAGKGWARIRSEQTHCIWGHEFTEANTYRRSDGCRECWACKRAMQRGRRGRKDSQENLE